MAIKQFAVPLDGNSQRPGDRTFKQLSDAGTRADFQLTNTIASGSLNELNLITKKNGVTKDHRFNASDVSGTQVVSLTAANLAAIFADANGGDWDYVEAKWTTGQVDTPNVSSLFIVQDNQTYNYYGW